MTSVGRRRLDESGFTLTEVLVVTSILAVIGFVLTQSIILGLRTTDATSASSSRSVATQTLASFFTGDAQSADVVSTSDPGCSSSTAGLIVTLSWADQGVNRTVSYGLEPATGPDRDLVRWTCDPDAPGDPAKKILGHFSTGPGDPVPVSASCDGSPCIASSSPDKVTLDVQSGSTLSLTVRRRTGATT